MDLHQSLTNALISAFQNRGYTILKAAGGAYTEPYKIGRHKPDIIAKDNNGLLIIGEAKIGEDLFSERAKEQFLDFSSRIMSEGPLRGVKIPLHIIVQQKDVGTLRQVLGNLGLANKIGERIFIWSE